MSKSDEDAFNDGHDAFYDCRPETANPDDESTDEFMSWNDGYIAAAEDAE